MITKDQLNLIAHCTSNVLGFIKNPTVMEYKRALNNKTLLQIITSACVITVDTGITPESTVDTKMPLYKLGAPNTWKKSSKGLILPTLTDTVSDKLAHAVYDVGDEEAKEFNGSMNTLAFLPITSLKGSFDVYPEYAIEDSENSAYLVYTDRSEKDSMKILGYEHVHNAVSLAGFFVRLSKDTVNFIDSLLQYSDVIDGVCFVRLCHYTALRFVSKALKMTITLVCASQDVPVNINIENKIFTLNSNLTFSKGDYNVNVELKTALPSLDPVDFTKKDIIKPVDKPEDTSKRIVVDDKNNVIQLPITITAKQEDNTEAVTDTASSDNPTSINPVEDFDSISDNVLDILETIKNNKKDELDKLKNISVAIKKLKRMHKSEVKDAASNVKQIEEFEKMKNTLKKIQGFFEV